MKYFEERLFATREQELLLQAALLKGFDATKAWQEWKSTVDVEGHLDNGSFRLLPLLYMNLKRHGIEDPFIDKLKGIYRKAWYKNQTLFYDMGKIIRYFHDAGIKTMLLKGAPLTVLHYKNYGVRPMADIDILIPRFQVSLAFDLLYRAGWKPEDPFNEGDLLYDRSRMFKAHSGTELDLHWRPFAGCQESYVKDFWVGAVPLALADVSTLSPNSTDMLFHVIIHGVIWNPEPPIRWIADAMSLINSPNAEIDWMRLINQAKRHRVCLRVKEGLNYLHARFQARVPKSIMDTTNSLQISLLELIVYRHNLSTPENRANTPFAPFAPFAHFMSYVYTSLSLNNGFRLVGLSDYLQWIYNVKGHYNLFSLILSKSIKRLMKILLPSLMTHSSK
jgi:hypothetical protein